MTTMFLTSGSTWTVPSDWNASGATIECIGPGGNGGKDPNNYGGQGGGYGKVTSPSNINVGDTLSIQIGAGGSTNPTWLKNNASIDELKAIIRYMEKATRTTDAST